MPKSVNILSFAYRVRYDIIMYMLFLYYKYHLAMKHAKDVGLMHPRKSRSIKHRHAEQRWIIITYTNYIAKHAHDTLTFLIQTD